MPIRSYLALLVRHWMLILLVFALGVTASLAASLVQPNRYTATAEVFVSADSGSDLTQLNQGAALAQSVVRSYANLAETDYVLQRVRTRLDLAEPASSLAQTVDAESPTDTTFVDITVTGNAPAQAARVADAVADELILAVERLSRSGGTSASVPSVNLARVQSAASAIEQVSPTTRLNVVIGAVAGLIAGLMLALLRETLDNKVRTAATVESSGLGAVLASVPFDRKLVDQPLATLGNGSSHVSEAYLALRTQLQFIDFDRGKRTFVVSSARAGEGKSTTAVNLAIAVARAKSRVLLLDADLRRPALARYLGVEGDVGLSQVLVGGASMHEAIQTWNDGVVDFLPSGRIPPNPTELLQSKKMSELLGALANEYDIVVVDAPPLLPVIDAGILAHSTSGAILVAAAGQTRLSELGAAREVLTRLGAVQLGIVVTKVRNRHSATYGYGSYGAPREQTSEAQT